MAHVPERRSHARAPFGAKLDVVFDDQAQIISCVDISVGGVRLATSLPHNTRLKLVLSVPSQQRAYVIHGEVAWRRLHTSGVRFLGLSSEAQRHLHEYVESQDREGGQL